VAEVTCPSCATVNPATNFKCSNCGTTLPVPGAPEPAPRPVATGRGFNPILIVALVGIVLACCIGGYIYFNQTDEVRAEVGDVNWQRSIVVLGLAPVNRQNWRDQIPSNADVGSCSEQVRYRSDYAEVNSREVCGEPYTVDTGSGFGEVVQDCYYEVYDDYCQYTSIEMIPVTTLVERGNDLSPRWPEVRLGNEEQQGEATETYSVEFQVDGREYTYTPRDASAFQQFRPGSEWNIEVNNLGNIVDIQPAQ
jgi:hypothetical protein